MSMNGLKQFITSVRQSKDADDESKKVHQELKHIFDQFQKLDNSDNSSTDQRASNYNIRKYICKLIYIQLSGYDVFGRSVSEKSIKVGIDQCLKLLNSQLSNYSNNNKTDIDTNLKDWKVDREIGFLGLKKLFSEYLIQENFESIVNAVLVDISSTIVFQNEKNKNILNSIWINVSIGLQSIGDLIVWVKDLLFDLPFLTELVNSVLELLHLQGLKVPEFVKIRAIMCLSQLFKLTQLVQYKADILSFQNLSLVLKAFAQSSLKDKNVIVALCSLFEKWLVFDWENIANIEGLLTTKLAELTGILGNVSTSDWIQDYGFMIISLFDVLSKITTVSNNKNLRLKKILDEIISNSINTNANLSRENVQVQLIDTSVLFSGLELYVNDVNEYGNLNGDDISRVIESIIGFLNHHVDINVKISCLKKLIQVMEKSNDYGHGRKSLLGESTLWKKYIHDKDLYVCQLTCEVLFTALKGTGDDETTYTQIKDVLIYQMYYLQKCESSERGAVLSQILTILEQYKDCGIIQEISRKLLKIFIMIGNCDDSAWVRIYELIIYSTESNTDLIEVVIEFIVKGLSIGCCENFIKLSCLVFKKNCEIWQIGDLELQLGHVIDKYENSTLLTKLLILDTMNSYYTVIKDEKLKHMINMAFEQEMQCNNIEIKQRAHEYFTIIKLNLVLENDIGVHNITKLPELTSTKPKKSQLSKNWEDGYIRLLRFDQGIFYDSSSIRIIFRVKRFKGYSQIDFNYKLKAEVSGFECGVIGIKDEFYDVQVENKGIDESAKSGSLVVKYSIKKMYAEDDEPVIQFQIPSVGETVSLKLPLALKTLRTSEGNQMSIQTFQSRWNQIGQFLSTTGCYKREVPIPLAADGETLSHLVELIVRIMKKMNFEVITAETSAVVNDYTITCASILDTGERGSAGCLCVLTSSSVEVRCTGEGIVQAICDRIVVVLRNVN